MVPRLTIHSLKFRVVADDCPERPIVANSATGVWTAIVKKANEIRNRDHSNSGIANSHIVGNITVDVNSFAV